MGTTIMTFSSLAFVVALLDAALGDLRRLRIANRVPLILLAAFVPYALSIGMDGGAWLAHLGAGVVCFILAAGLFAAGVWGGGDAKLLPAVALWAGAEALPRLLLVMGLAGGLVALATLAARHAAAGRAPLPRQPQAPYAPQVPYGIAIAAAGLDWAALHLLPGLVG